MEYLRVWLKENIISRAGLREALDPLGDNVEFEDDEDGRTIVGTIIFKTTESVLRVSKSK